jgi:hypothetical protein
MIVYCISVEKLLHLLHCAVFVDENYCYLSPSHSGVGISASVPSPDNHHSTALETGSSHKLYRTGGPNGTAASCPPPSVSEPYSPPKVTMTCCVPFRSLKIGEAQFYAVLVGAMPLQRYIFVHS